MMIDAQEARGRRRLRDLQLTPTSGLALGLAVSGALWVGVVEMVRLIVRI
jgi:hypothetical protein